MPRAEHTVRAEASTGRPSAEAFEQMARRRYQQPVPERHGKWWTLRLYRDHFVDGQRVRRRNRIRLGPSSLPAQQIKKVAAKYLQPLNEDGEGGAINFGAYVAETYKPLEMPLLAKSTQSRYQGIIDNYLLPAFSGARFFDMTPWCLQRYFTGLSNSSALAHESQDKIRDVLASIFSSAVKYKVLVSSPVSSVRLGRKKGGHKSKPFLSPEQFSALLALIPEPYATMLFVAIYTGLRISELAALRWNDIHHDTITIDERFCRGDWGAPKSDASNATIGVNRCVIERIHRLKLLTVKVRAGRAVRTYRAVKADGPDDLVFQSVQDGRPIRDNNILVRFIKPAARKVGLPWVNWRCLRTSHATWLKLAGADVKDAQAQMRHSRASTTLDIYQQFVPASQKRAVDRLSTMANEQAEFLFARRGPGAVN